MDKLQDDSEEPNSEENKFQVCRLCLGNNNVTVNINQETIGFTSIIDKIRYCTSLVVKKGDKLPQNICTCCAKNLDLMYAFKSKAITCDLKLSKTMRNDTTFTYSQVSDDPMNMTFKLNLEESDDIMDSNGRYVYKIVDADALTIEPVNDTIGKDKNITDIMNSKNDPETVTIQEVLHKNPKINTSASQTVKKSKESAVVIKRELNKIMTSTEELGSTKKQKLNGDIMKPVLVVKNGKVMYYCNLCSYEAESMNTLISHRTRVHTDHNHKCSECSSSFKSPGLLRRHSITHSEMVFKCKFCDKRFAQNQTLERHINTMHNNSESLEFQCVKCNAYFETLDEMEDHLVVHYINPSNSFSCSYCKRSFNSYLAMNKHIDVEHVVKVECSICHMVLPTKEAMEKHNVSVHKPKTNGNKKYECTKCKKCFHGLKDILNHRKTHITDET
ncbi:zinc finger protein 85-like [Adelges cooleyi]|uniref:zinc finger protein 85-like n=1 Tax=Adelges cooleyi TaxID=133065 RepID=UPI00217F4E54|nr:zinc finger protein 85-like [Adelges cooleyi]